MLLKPEETVLFHGKESPFSNWHLAPFQYRGYRFLTVEMFMMLAKARYFGDTQTEALMWAATHPGEHKKLGRQVRGYDEAFWQAKRERVVYTAKYHQALENPHIHRALMENQSKYFVEASPSDRIWGVGLGADDPRIYDTTQWRGSNLLGEILNRLSKGLAASGT